MKVEIIRTTEEFYKLKNIWNDLVEQSNTLTYYDTFDYNYHWWTCFESKSETKLFILILYNKLNQVIAIFPLMIKENQHFFLKEKVLSFLSKGDYHNIITISDNTNLNKVFNLLFLKLLDSKTEFDKVLLTHLNISSAFSKYLMKHQEYNKHFNLLVETPVLKKNEVTSLISYKKAFLSKNVKNLNNRLLKDVNYTFEVTYNNCIDIISKVHIEQQKEDSRDGRRSLYQDKKRQKFLYKLYSKNKHITFLIKNKDGEVIAYQTAYVHKKTINFWNMGYQLNYTKYSIGRIGVWKMIEWFIESECFDELDFGSGRYPWKFQWTDEMNSVYKLEYYVNHSIKIKFVTKVRELKRVIKCFLIY
ncbi:cellulose biosynthesis protein [Psychromonas sp. CNPT3]|uniref:GNAT family N-acetyltransferase n=1 Tax=Psychromonas sp. CNPT3 TaxID=314282 RepID=UPI0002C051CA|nr:GNAT family N-acetyltransferase [Psychromonas sp. CNPT3]AGH82281.1 cellulose biosynthesis protein [Psychromonas sp. CNPT3]